MLSLLVALSKEGQDVARQATSKKTLES